MDSPPPSQASHLFTVRLWAEVLSADRIEWRGKLQHVLSGEVRYFRDWPTLIAQIEELLVPRQDNNESGGAASEAP